MSNHIDGQFLQFYTEELDYLRRMSGEFAREFPAVAGRLDLTQFDCEDPWVERTLEGVAFLTARVRRELNGGLPRATGGRSAPVVRDSRTRDAKRSRERAADSGGRGVSDRCPGRGAGGLPLEFHA